MIVVACAMAAVGGFAGNAWAGQVGQAGAGADAQEIESAEQLRDRIVAAYRKLDTYQSKITFSIRKTSGRWFFIQQGDVQVGFDRNASRFLLDKPDLRMVIENGELLLRARRIPGAHLETVAPDRMDYQKIQLLVPEYATPHIPDAIMLLDDSPMEAVVHYMDSTLTLLEPDAEDHLKRPGLEIKTTQGTVTFRVDPHSYLITRAVYASPEIEDPEFETQMWYEFDIKIMTANEELAVDAFAFDRENSIAMSSLRELKGGKPLADMQGGGEGGEGDRRKGPALMGKNAPLFVADILGGGKLDLESVGDQVIVLDFSASWCVPCRQSLPLMEKVHAWAKEKKKPVSLYVVPAGEEATVTRRFLDGMKLEHFPVLINKDDEINRMFEVKGIPCVVVIHQGVIQHIQEGFHEKMDTVLIEKIEALLSL